jgi:hypothetical protein
VPSALSNDGTNHHDQRLRNILDAQSDVLDTLNAMTKVHIDKTDECMEILYDLYTDAMMFSHRGKILAPSSHSKYHCYYMVFKDLEEIINRQYSKAQREHKKIATLNCPYCDLPVDYYRTSPPPDYDPPKRTTHKKHAKSRSGSRSPKRCSPQSPQYSPTGVDATASSSSSSSDDLPPPPRMPPPTTHVALLNLNDNDNINDLQLQHLDIRKILKTTDTGGTRELQLA